VKEDRENEQERKCGTKRKKWPKGTEMNEDPLAIVHRIETDDVNVSKKRHGNKSPENPRRGCNGSSVYHSNSRYENIT
jgi:hypothetical protein